jgi:hypothetical protein
VFHSRIPSVAAIVVAVVCFMMPTVAQAQASCGPLPMPAGGVIDVTPLQVDSLQSILDRAQPGQTVQLADGVYSLPQTLVMRVPGVTLRSRSRNRDSVVLDGRYGIGNVILIRKSNITVADVTLTRADWHLVHVAPDGPVTNTLLHNLRGVDGSEQFIKVNPSNGAFADHGVIRCSSLELTDVGRPFVRNNCYTGGIDIHQSRGWQLYANVASGFWCASGLPDHAIHVWTGSRDTRVERNIVINSARGIGFGLGSSVLGRTYGDAPCGGAVNVGHYGGVIINNIVSVNDARVFASGYGFDTGIGLEQSCETNVLHNTVASTAPPRSSSIEWRFANSVVAVANNLVTHSLLARDGARASLGGNVAQAPLAMFVNAAGGNLHLVPTAAAAIDKAAPLNTSVSDDIDGDARRLPADVGADEYVAPAPSIALTATPSVQTGGAIEAAWSLTHGVGSSGDWIGFYASGAPDSAPLDRKMTAGLATGTVFFTAPAAPGTYDTRYISGTGARLAASRPIVVSAPPLVSPPPPAVDTTAPVVRITSPGIGERVSGTVVVRVNATDNVRVTKVELYVNGVLTGTSALAPFATEYTPPQSARGLFTVQVRAYDAAGNRSWSQMIAVRR